MTDVDPTRATHVACIRGEAGSGPPLVFVPGLDGSGELLLGTAERLARRFRVVRLAYRTKGAVPPTGDDYGSLARSVAECLDEAGIERAIVLAESFGGAVAIQLALDAPERVAALAIVNSFVRYDRRRRARLSRQVLRLTPGFAYELGRKLFSPFLLIGPRRDRDAAREFRAAPLRDLDGGYLRRLTMVTHVDLLDRLSEVRQPVALFASDKDRVVPSVRAARTMHERLPNATFETLPSAGHVVLPLAEEPWLERLEALLARCEVAPT
ncbi:MAG: alpha/beta fold hydrolase [bacterium]|nr:alpha/beta fold hydrolase [bacterium]